jgi:hypothetical protein
MPVDTRAKLSSSDGQPVADPSEYKSLVGALQYITMTRPDLAYAVQQACLHMHNPREAHLALVKRILRYVRGCISTARRLWTLSPTPTPTGPAAPTHVILHPATLSSSVMH